MLNNRSWLTIQEPMGEMFHTFFGSILNGKAYGDYHLVFGDEAMSQVPISIYIHKLEPELSSTAEYYQLDHISEYEFAGDDVVREVVACNIVADTRTEAGKGSEGLHEWGAYLPFYDTLNNLHASVLEGGRKLISIRKYDGEEKLLYREFGHTIELKKLVTGVDSNESTVQ